MNGGESLELQIGERIASCGKCGAQGIEDAHDPFPGICPDCLEQIFKASLDLINTATETFNHIADANKMVDKDVTGKDHLQVEDTWE